MLYYFIKKQFRARQHPEERADKAEKAKQKRPCRHQRRNQIQATELDPVPFDESRNQHDPTSANLLSPPDPAHEQIPSNGPCEKCKKEKHDARVYRSKLIAGLVFPYFLASVDLTIVASAMPFIASHFTFGQLADVYGRHFVLQLAMFLMLVGSVFYAAARTWGMLLFGRALQGTSSAGIMNLIEIVLADNVSLKENAKNTTIFQFVSGVSYGVGPVIGGYLTDANWRYCFVISIPIAVFAHFAIFFLLRKELVRGTHLARSSSSILSGLATIDSGGTVLFILGIGLIILGTSWGGATYPWTSAAVLVPLISGSILFSLFFVYEYYLEPGRVLSRVFPQQTPMVPFPMFKVKDTSLLAILEFATGAVGVYLAMFACNVWPAQTFTPLSAGTLIETVGVALITWAVTTRNIPLVNGMMAVAGAGTGLRFMPSSLHAAGIWPDKIAPAMSIMRFCLPFGGTLALAIMGSVFNNKMTSIFHPNSESQNGGIDIQSSQSLDDISKLPLEVQEHIRTTGKDAVMWAFISIMPIMAISFVTGIFLGNVWIKKKGGGSEDQIGKDASTSPADDDEDIESNEVVYVSYLWARVTGTLDEKKRITRPLTKAEKQRQAAALLEAKTAAGKAQRRTIRR
ncbi:MFS multidrug transporter [Blastomyces dermatitidis ER-3]|uniref:MFS multidrug transporter n=1 Tax=Ajellomyces dermatitidis (strain ER-3 / ATCC MYA-2586) TaxID=559297 RepID=A0ABP2ERK8_AJEDR|nr:MFS multidrug transporter [Blastomyces dermatitidis ER-3]EEQ86326.1 MFS multidrug transporter [Blastomyces dermatitidis ER-3]EQL29737.1 hypothetical protein BDFG_07678 [Blastomyces dermatitidis ATCC 26199]